MKSKDSKQERQATPRNEDLSEHRPEDSIEGPIQSDAEVGFGPVGAREATGYSRPEPDIGATQANLNRSYHFNS